MSNSSESNAAKAASKFVNNTHKHIFLTGKAGTGKTTFLKHIVKHTHKNTMIAASTGIAAINAGGVTLHSLFQLPFGAFVPKQVVGAPAAGVQVNTPESLLRQFKMHETKRKLLRELELLIIDEVSMLRADLLDAIDVTLRKVRGKSVPFGGVQILFIGDLLQLPPVVKDMEWKALSAHYRSINFFDAVALRGNEPVYIELDKIYRQADDKFITILNNLRNNKILPEDMAVLNQYHRPEFKPKEGDGYIFLSTHNRKADTLNLEKLSELPGKSATFEAEVKGDFHDNNYPIEKQLELKEGAQVMFVKNDYSGMQRYFNGKIGKVSKISEEGIWVDLDDDKEPIFVEKYLWENKKYELNSATGEIEEKTVGSFFHYPLKLAWAITVHKSQGLTFEKAIIDVSKAFAPGQIYVALSRLTSLDGLVLNQPIQPNSLQTNSAVQRFAETKPDKSALVSTFRRESLLFLGNQLLEAFNFKLLISYLDLHLASYNKEEGNRSTKQKYLPWAKELLQETKPLEETAGKFAGQIQSILHGGELEKLQERVTKATAYFHSPLVGAYEKVLDHIRQLNDEKRIKTYLQELEEIDRLIFRQLERIHRAEAVLVAHLNNSELSKEEFQNASFYKERLEALESRKIVKSGKSPSTSPKPKVAKKPTAEISFELQQTGKSIAEIAEERGLTNSTIAGHLTKYIELGQLRATDFMSLDKMNTILKASETIETEGSWKALKEHLGDDFSYSDIKMVMAEKRAVEA